MTRLNDPAITASIGRVLDARHPDFSADQRARVTGAVLGRLPDICRDEELMCETTADAGSIERGIAAAIQADPAPYVVVPTADRVLVAEDVARRALGLQPLTGAARLTRHRELAAAAGPERIEAKRAADAAVTANGETPAAPEAKTLAPALDRSAEAEALARAQLAAVGEHHPSGVKLRTYRDAILHRNSYDERDAELRRSLELKVQSGAGSPADRLTLGRLGQKSA